jgi:uncharacterized protein with PQ loop repeat
VITAALSVVAVSCGVTQAWPQVTRIVTRGDVSGVSGTTWLMALAAGLVWETIGVLERVPALVVFNVLYSLGAATVLVMLWRHGTLRGGTAAGVVASVLAVIAGVHLVVGRTGVSVLGVTISTVMFLPQVVEVFRRPVTGVSAMTWWCCLVSSAAWGAYGTLTGTWVLIAANVVMTPAAALVIWRVHTAGADQSRTPHRP